MRQLLELLELLELLGLTHCAPITAAYILIHFLFYAGLPYLLLRTAIRNNNAVLINAMYKYMIDPFRSTNKYNYARLCVYSIHMHFILKPALRDIWDRMRTASLRGHTGRNVGWDFTLERMNLEVAQLLGSNISGERIQEVIRQLNGIRHVRGPALDAFGIGDPQGNEYNGINDTDVSIVVGHLRDAFKLDGTNDAGKLCAKKSNFFKTNDPEWKGLPWTRIAKVEESLGEYAVRMVGTAPQNDLRT